MAVIEFSDKTELVKGCDEVLSAECDDCLSFKEVTMLPGIVAGERFRNDRHWRHDRDMMSDGKAQTQLRCQTQASLLS